jgi:topoisomerase IV subunit A
VLDGYLIAYLNIDEVIRIVRFEDDPKAALIAKFKLTEVQAEAILNLRLRSLSKLEEQDIRAEHDKLSKEQRELQTLLKSDQLQWDKIGGEIKATREKYSKKTKLGARRTILQDAPEITVDLDTALIEKEPITVIISDKGWIRALKGHQDDLSKLEFKQGDSLRQAVKASTTDKLILFATNGRFYTLGLDQLPGGRGHGEPVRLMVDIEENHDFLNTFVHEPGRKLLVASTAGYGFVVPEVEVLASTRKGKQVLNVGDDEQAKICVPVKGDMVAVIGENRKMLVYGLDEINELVKGKGVILQKYKDGGLSDARVFAKAAGLTWLDSAGRTHTLATAELGEWTGARAQAGQGAPPRFPKTNKFGPAFG